LKNIFRKKSLASLQGEAGVPGEHESGLKRVLTVKDLTLMGVAAVIGGGIFTTIGSAAYNGGPGVIFLFIITAITCGFTALCYAEFASRIPVAGSAYTYSYVSFGEVVAWIIGWALILEYAIGNIVVAISWSAYFNNILHAMGLALPDWLTIGYQTAHLQYTAAMAAGEDTSKLIYTNAPDFLGIRLIVNLPAFIIVALITWLAYVGIKESKKTANAMVMLKIIVLVLIALIGFWYIFSNNTVDNWTPFLPNGMSGVLKGVSAVFFAYIGFDAISTTAEECSNPQRDLPRGMFEKIQMREVGFIISVSAVVAASSVLLVFQIGQPRIWMVMSRDGLLPKSFGKIDKKYKTPGFSTIVTGLFVGSFVLFIDDKLMTDLTSIGTLFAFALVSGGVLVLPRMEKQKGKFSLPYINAKWIFPLLYLLFIYFFRSRIIDACAHLFEEGYQEFLFLIFVLFSGVLAVFSFLRQFSLIPILGVSCCMYLMVEIPANSWLVFFGWMSLGLLIYFFYGKNKSKLNAL